MALGPVIGLLLLRGELLAVLMVIDLRTKTYGVSVEKACSVPACVIHSG